MDLHRCDTAGDNSANSQEMLPNSSNTNNFYFGDFSVSSVQRPTLISNFESAQQQQMLGGGGGGAGPPAPHGGPHNSYGYWHQSALNGGLPLEEGGRSPNSSSSLVIDPLTSSSATTGAPQVNGTTPSGGASITVPGVGRPPVTRPIKPQQQQQQQQQTQVHGSNLAQLRRSPVPRPFFESPTSATQNQVSIILCQRESQGFN